jgi:hypothetical protein
MIHEMPRLRLRGQTNSNRVCEHRTVSKEGRIVCKKIVEGENTVSPNLCRNCPLMTVNCSHLRCSLQRTFSSPLIVRYNGHTEVWDDDPPVIKFHQAACATRVMPIDDPRTCSACTLREVQCEPSPGQSLEPHHREPAAAGKVVPFPRTDAVAAGA